MSIGVHRTHCCPDHGCKYCEPDCPVVSKIVEPQYPNNNGCELCELYTIKKDSIVAWEVIYYHTSLYGTKTRRSRVTYDPDGFEFEVEEGKIIELSRHPLIYMEKENES